MLESVNAQTNQIEILNRTLLRASYYLNAMNKGFQPLTLTSVCRYSCKQSHNHQRKRDARKRPSRRIKLLSTHVL